MEKKDLRKTVTRAIKEKKTLRLQIVYDLGQQIEIDLEPYIFGSDMTQYDFVWGFIRHNGTSYKLLTKFIVTWCVSDTAFTVQPDTICMR